MIAFLPSEPGGHIVDVLLTSATEQCFAHAINLVEVYYNCISNHNEPTARQALADLAAGGVVTSRDVDEPFLLRVVQLKAQGRISLADRFCIVAGPTMNVQVVTRDHHEFDPLVLLGTVPGTFIR